MTKQPKKRGRPNKDYSFDHLDGTKALLERNKEKNFDGKRIKGLRVNAFADMVTQPGQEDSEYNKNGRQKHDI